MQTMTRKQFIQRTALTAVGLRVIAGAGLTGIALSQEGCDAQTVIRDLKNWVPVGLDAFEGLVMLIPGIGPGVTAAAELVRGAFGQLSTDLDLYQNQNPPPADTLAKIESALQILVSNFGAFLASVNVTDAKLQATVVNLAQIILSTIAAFASGLPKQGTLRSKLVASTYRTGTGQTLTVRAKERTRRQFKKDYNAAAAAGGHSEIKLKLSFFEHF